MATYDNVKFTNKARTSIVYLATIKVDENYINKVKVFTTPTESSTPDTSLAVNLNRMEDRYTIHGKINYGKLGTETHTSAKDKKDLLKTIVSQGETAYVTYEGTEIEVTVEKYQITDTAADNSDSKDGEGVYDVTITCVVSDDVIKK